MNAGWVILIFLAGAFLPIQAGLNNRMGKAIESPVHASLLSFIVATVGVFIYMLITQHPVTWAGLKTVPVYLWFAGLVSAFNVTIIILAFPRIGAPLTFGLIVAGQMLISVVLEHFNILVEKPHPFNYWRLLGICLILAGVILIRKP